MAAAFRPKTLDLAGPLSTKVIRDHTKRQVFERTEPQRYLPFPVFLPVKSINQPLIQPDKPSGI